MVERLISTVGIWVDGDRFYGRDTDIKLFNQRLRDGSHIQLLAIRRMGKTSLMHEASRRLDGEFICLHVDLEGCSTAAEAIVKLSIAINPVQGLWNRAKEVFTNVLGAAKDSIDTLQLSELSIKLREGIGPGDWAAKGDRLFDILASSDKPVIVFFDEVPILVNRLLKNGKSAAESRESADEFMSWLRRNSMRPAGKVMIVVTGSIGLEPMLRKAGLSATLNTFAPFELMPWSPETAVSCLKALANEYDLEFEDGVCQQMVQRLEYCIPYHVQLYFSCVQGFCVQNGYAKISSEIAENVYSEKMIGPRGTSELSHYEERLRMILDDQHYQIAKHLLTQTAVTGSLDIKGAREACAQLLPEENKDDTLTDLLYTLEHDGYLKQEDGHHVFASQLVRDWWKNRFGIAYLPADERTTD